METKYRIKVETYKSGAKLYFIQKQKSLFFIKYWMYESAYIGDCTKVLVNFNSIDKANNYIKEELEKEYNKKSSNTVTKIEYINYG